MSVYEKMIREGEWWDFIDPISQGLIGILLMNSRREMNLILDKRVITKKIILSK